MAESTFSGLKITYFEFLHHQQGTGMEALVTDGFGTVVPEVEGKGAPGLAAACSHQR